jgi:spore maturation protein CgeB
VITSLLQAGLRVGLYGGQWERFEETRRHTHGQADMKTLRLAHSCAKVALCLPRHANRDGHTMRTFELAAMRACVLAEYSEEHRQILGEDGEAVVYFRSPAEMLDRTRWLLAHDDERERLMTAVHARVTGRPNAYRDRLEAMLTVSSAT